MGEYWTTSRRRLTLVAGALMLSTACWGQTGGNAANQNANPIESAITPGTVGALAPAWTAPGVADAVWGNRVVGASRSAVRSLDAATGAEQWSVAIDDPPGVGVAAARVGATVVGDDVLASYTWGVYSPHGVVCGGQTLRLDLATGEQEAPPSAVPSAAIVPFGDRVATYDQPYIYPGDQGPVQVPCAFGHPTAVSVVEAATGATQWTGAVGGRPVVLDDQLLTSSGTTLRSYVASGCGATTCDPTWTAVLPATVAELAADAGGRLYALTAAVGDARQLLALDRTDGSVDWSAPLPAGAATMTVAAGRVHVAAGTTLATFGRAGCGSATCAPLWTAALPAAVAGNVASGGGVVYAATTGGAVLAYDAGGCGAAACEPLATVTVAATPTRTIVDGGRLFVTSWAAGTQTITAFAPA
jgi:hypothetical protein